MDDKDKDSKIPEDDISPLPGQMNYDEILSSQPINENKEEDLKQEKSILQGQVNLFDLTLNESKENSLNKKSEKKEKNIKDTFNNAPNQQEVEKIKLEKQKKVQNSTKEQKIKQDIEYEEAQDSSFEKEIPDSKVKSKKKKKQAEQVMERQSTIYVALDEVMHNSMIPYTEHVVLDRALPRVEDGLKPVQRRILYSMLELGLFPDKQYRKSARIVGDCMGKYHPHGDSSVYDAMVRMSQNFSLREPLVSGHGNFGSIDGDSAAAMRYTEAKLTPLAMTLLKDIEKNTVKWGYNFDDTLKEPEMLPAGFPNLLVNGASGIAVGVATNIPPHNLQEVIDATVAYIADNKITLDEIMKILPAPDFPTGGLIIAGDELKQAYETGRGKIILRAKATIEKDGDKQQIVITELPYQVNKANLLKKIADLKTNDKDRLSGVGEIRDESDRTGLRAVIRLKKDANAQAVLDYLYKTTQLQGTFGINMVAIAGGRPRQLGILELINYYVEYRREVIFNRTQYDCKIAKDRAHIIEGLLVAIANIDEVIKIIKRSDSVQIAKVELRKKFVLTDIQAQAILDMRLARFVNLEVVKLENELKELKEKIAYLEGILSSKKKQYNVVKNELLEVKKQFGNKRRSKIIEVDDIKQAAVMTEDEEQEAFAKEVMVAITAGGTVKQIPVKNYALSQKDLTKTSTLFDVHTTLFKIMTNDSLLIFTNKGNVYKTIASALPEAKWREKGQFLEEFVKNADIGEIAIAALPITEENKEKNVFFFTQKGYAKSIKFSDIVLSKNFYSVSKLKDDDEVLTVEIDSDAPSIIMVSKSGNALNFSKDEVPMQSRNASGVMGINIEPDDEVLFAGLSTVKGAITLVSENGWAKKLPVTELNLMGRYRKGQTVFFFSEKAKNLVYASYSEVASNVVIAKGERLSLISQRTISYDTRTSKGKQISKGKLTNAYNYEL